MRLIDGDLIYKAIPAEEDNNTGMGMTFDEMDAYNDGIDAMYRLIQGAPTVEAIPKADYEARLKADLVAMLTDFLMDIEENTSINSDDNHERNGKRLMRTEIIGMFEQKIDKLKESTDGNK